MKVQILQIDTQWMNRQANFETIADTIKDQDKIGQLIVLPEMFDTGYIMTPSDLPIGDHQVTVEFLQAISIKHNTTLLGTFPCITDRSNYNRMAAISKGKIIGTYDKVHLFAPAGEGEQYTKGSRSNDFIIEDVKIRPLICYDLRFPYLSYNTSDYDILVYSANWPVSRIDQWKQLLIARAIENQAFVIAANRVGRDSNGYQYNGQSMIIDYKGHILAQADDEVCMISATLDMEGMRSYRQSLPFLKDQIKYRLDD